MRSPITTIACVIITLALQSNADRILIESPEQGSQLSKAENVEIRYTVRFQDMALLGSASTSLLYPNGTVAVANISKSTRDQWDETRTTTTSWQIPKNISDGDYVLQVAGPAGYRCSQKQNGQAPYGRCSLTISDAVNVTIGNSPASQTMEDLSVEKHNTTSPLLASSSSGSKNLTAYPSLTPDIFYEQMQLNDAVTNKAIRHISDPVSIVALAVCLMFSIAF